MESKPGPAKFQFRIVAVFTITAVLAFLFAALGGILRGSGAASNQFVVYFVMMMMAPLVMLLLFGLFDRWRGISDAEDDFDEEQHT